MNKGLSDCVRMCSSHLIRHNGDAIFEKPVTGDEKWVLYENSNRKKTIATIVLSATVPQPNIHHS